MRWGILAPLEIVALCPFGVAPLLWQARSGEWTLTLVVKATFQLEHGADAVLAATQIPIADDRFWSKAAGASLRAPGDFAPFKPKADIVLVGHAYAPGGRACETVDARLRVGDFAKTVRVVGDRAFVRAASGLVPGPPAPFTHMPMRYEHAAFGVDNPVGVEVDPALAVGGKALPNLEPTGATDLAGFGPVAPTWRSRRALLDDDAQLWALGVGARGRVVTGPAPETMDFGFFNVAPREQQVDLLRAGAVIALENLHPAHARFETRLPAIRPKAFMADPATGRPREIALRCDTLWIDADEGIATVCWRGLTGLASGDERDVPRIAVAAHSPDRPAPKAQIDRLLREGRDDAGEDAGEPASASHPLGVRHDAVKAGRRVETFGWPEAREVEPAKGPIDEGRGGTTRKLQRGARPAPALPFASHSGGGGASSGPAATSLEVKPIAPAMIDELGDSTTTDSSAGASAARLGSLDVAGYAGLVVAIERGEVRRALGAMGLDLPDVARLLRAWASHLAGDATLAAQVGDAVDALRDARDAAVSSSAPAD